MRSYRSAVDATINGVSSSLKFPSPRARLLPGWFGPVSRPRRGASMPHDMTGGGQGGPELPCSPLLRLDSPSAEPSATAGVGI